MKNAIVASILALTMTAGSVSAGQTFMGASAPVNVKWLTASTTATLTSFALVAVPFFVFNNNWD